MALDLTLAVLVRMAGPALFALLGIAVMALARGNRERLALGAFFAAFGAWLVSSNLGAAGGGAPFFTAAIVLVLAAATVGAGSLACLPREERPGRGGMAVLAMVAVLAATWWLVEVPRVLPNAGFARLISADAFPAFVLYLKFAVALVTAMIMVPAAWALVAWRAPEARLRLFAGLAAGLLVFWGFAAGTDILSGLDGVFFVAYRAGFAIVLAGSCMWLWVAIRRESRPARNVALAGLAAILAGMLRHATTGVDSVFDPLGAVGLARLVGWAIIATTLVNAGWLDVSFLSRHRAGVATAALAALFIVAQIAENLVDSRYGLLVGGIVAGAMLFAASPIQKLIERSAVKPAPAPTRDADATSAGAPDAKREAYKRAVRLALRDRRLSPDEEVELAHVAHELGLTAPEAIRLRHEVEREAAR